MKKTNMSVISFITSVAMVLSVFVFAGPVNANARENVPEIKMTATVGEVGEEITVTVSGKNIAGLQSADLYMVYDSEYLEYKSITSAENSGFAQAFGSHLNYKDISWSFFFRTQADSDRDLAVLKFRVLKEGNTDITLEVRSWSGTESPDGTSVTIGEKEPEITVPEDPKHASVIEMVATEGIVGDTISVTVSGKDLAGLESADLEFHYDTEMLEFVGITAAEGADFTLSAGGDIGNGVITWSFFFKECTDSDKDLAVIEFLLLKEGSSDVSIDFWSWEGTQTPEVTSITVNAKSCIHADCETIPGYDATCTENGLSDGEKCLDCGVITVQQEEIPAKGHNLEWTEEYPATYFDSGSEIGTCTICGYTEKVEIPILIPDKDYTDEKTSIAVQYNEKLYDGDLEIKAHPESEGAAFNLLNDVKGNYKSQLFDIYVTLDGETIQPNGYVLVGIPLPEGYSTEMTKVYYVSPEDNSLTELPGSYFYEGYIWFQTDHFSSYAIVDESVEIEKPDTSASKLGDVNLDGEITASDARLVLRASAGLQELTVEQYNYSDINSDGEITASDARIILRISAGLDSIDNYIKEETKEPETTTKVPETTTKVPETTTKISNTTQNQEIGNIVYITPYGKRYHVDPECGGKNSYSVSISDVGGRTPCGTCIY